MSMARAKPARSRVPPSKPAAKLVTGQYAQLARFRYALRCFLHFSQSAAEGVGLTAQQYQAMLALRGWPDDEPMSINDLAAQLLIRHNSAVGLVDRLYKLGLVARHAESSDRRKVDLRLTARGARLLERLAAVHREELRRIGPQLRGLLEEISASDGNNAQTPR
jgi:DNA-binding MarR family transcriptional regulator